MSGVTMVTLKDGSQVPQVCLDTVSTHIQGLAKDKVFAFYDLVQKCKNAEHKILKTPFGDSTAILQAHELIDSTGRVHEDIRKIVLNSVEGSGLTLKFVDPTQKL